MSSFRMFKARGQPGCWYGYAELDGVTYKIDAKHVGKGVAKHFEGTIKRHLKADQQTLDLGANEHRMREIVGDAINRRVDREAMAHVPPGVQTGFDDDELPEDL